MAPRAPALDSVLWSHPVVIAISTILSCAIAVASPPGSAPGSAPPPPKPPTVIGGDPLDLPARSAGTTVLGERESAEAAEKAKEAAEALLAEPAAGPPLPPDPRRQAVLELHRRLFPPPLTEAEVDAWCVALELGPDAVAHARALVEEYLTRLRRFTSGEGLSLVIGGFQWSEQGDRLVPLWTPIQVALIARRAEYLAAMRSAESQLFSALLSLVVVERQPEARRLFFHRRFKIESPGEPGTLAGLDVATLVKECEFDPTDSASIAPALDTYIREADILFKQRLDAILELELQRANLEMGLGAFWELVTTPEDRLELAMELDELRAARGDLDRPLRDLTRDAVLNVASRLAPAGVIALTDRLVSKFPPALFDEEIAVSRLLSTALAEPELPAGGREGRLGFQTAVRLKLLPLGLEIGELSDRLATLPDARSGDLTIDRAAAVQRLELELQRLEAMRRRRAICRESAENLKMLLLQSEQRLFAQADQFERDLQMRSSAEAWMARRMRERISEIRARQAEDELAAEESAAGEGGGIDQRSGGTSDGAVAPELVPVGRGSSR